MTKVLALGRWLGSGNHRQAVRLAFATFGLSLAAFFTGQRE
jgi:hypothetical protein